MRIKRVQKQIKWTPEDRERHKSIRASFKGRPTIADLISRGELSGQPVALGAYVNLRLLLHRLRGLREEAGMSLAELSTRSGMDKAMLSRLETGQVPNPGIETITRYVNALDKDIQWRVVAAPKRRKAAARTK
jgi:DNA-binding Xre family transcriptional regulator